MKYVADYRRNTIPRCQDSAKIRNVLASRDHVARLSDADNREFYVSNNATVCFVTHALCCSNYQYYSDYVLPIDNCLQSGGGGRGRVQTLQVR